MRHRLTAEEYTGHAEDFVDSPWDEYRADLRQGMICALLASLMGDPKKGPFKPAQFMPYLKREQRAQDDVDSLNEFFGSIYGGG